MQEHAATIVELTGFEKSMWVHGNWVTICHAAHLTGDQSMVVDNIDRAIPHLLQRYPRMRARLRVRDFEYSLVIEDYHEERHRADLFYSIVTTNAQSWQELVENGCNRNPYTADGQSAFPLFQFVLALSAEGQPLRIGRSKWIHSSK